MKPNTIRPQADDERRRLEAARTRHAVAEWGPISASASGARSARTTAPTATRGTTSPTTRRARAPITGARTAWPASPTTSSSSASRSRCGTASDPILKERLFGLTNAEGNHGEDVKEYYFYLDSTPTHSYMKWLYKYPQRGVSVRRSGRDEPAAIARTSSSTSCSTPASSTTTATSTSQVEYAKASPEDILIRITATNRGAEAATLHVLPTLWFRNTWRWSAGRRRSRRCARSPARTAARAIAATHAELGRRWLYVDGDAAAAVHRERDEHRSGCSARPNATPLRQGRHQRLRRPRPHRRRRIPRSAGTKAAAHYQVDDRAGRDGRLAAAAVATARPSSDARSVRRLRRDRSTRAVDEADEFYRPIVPPSASPDEAHVMRQALAGMLWSKQYYYFDASRWLAEHGVEPFADRAPRRPEREWGHMVNADVISMPDKWEYPWYAAWDLAFHAVALSRSTSTSPRSSSS